MMPMSSASSTPERVPVWQRMWRNHPAIKDGMMALSQMAGFRPVNVTGRERVLVAEVGSIGDQAASGHKESMEVNRGQFLLSSKRDEQITMQYGQYAWQAAAFARWHEPDDARVSSPVLVQRG